MSDGTAAGRLIDIELYLAGGHSQRLSLSEGSPLLHRLFTALSSDGADGGFVQLPVRDGRAACSFHVSQLVAVVTQPPVVIQLDGAAAAETPQVGTEATQAIGAAHGITPEPAAPEPAITIEQPRFAVVEDFLSPDEHADMLAYALTHQEQFEPGTVAAQRTSHRENLVSMQFAASAHATLLANRLLTWFPVLTKQLEQPCFALDAVESQLTAGNDGHYYRLHNDSGHGETNPRRLSCVYYFFRDPKAFEGGELRLYDTERQGEETRPSKTFRAIEPVSNRLVVFPSDAFHEVRPVSCLSGAFADSRFAVTTWLRHRAEPDAEAAFGWGHLRCGAVSEPPVEGEPVPEDADPADLTGGPTS